MLYTIGHGTRPIESFIAALKQHQIQRVVDVRTTPYSRFNPQYNQKALQQHLENEKIEYIFMGDSLGGRPADQSLYTNGKPDYEKMKSAEIYLSGINQLEELYRQSIPLALMCSESKPAECHRSRLIGETLQSTGISLVHIDEKFVLRNHSEIMKLVKRDPPGSSLFH